MADEISNSRICQCAFEARSWHDAHDRLMCLTCDKPVTLDDVLTKEKLAMMSVTDIAKLDWQEVRRVLAEG